MPVFSDYAFPSGDGVTQIHVRRCTPDTAPRAVLQIAHGIAEHVERYDEFAAYLAENGFLVVATDHLGHGQSVSADGELGHFADENGWMTAVGDMHRLYQLTHADFPELPYFLFGHSMGSFLTRTYLLRWSEGLSGAVICGTGQQPAAVVAGGKLASALEIKKHGPRYHSDKLNTLAFGGYNKAFQPARTPNDWLTRDEAHVDRYNADPLCGFVPTAGLFHDMMGGIQMISKLSNVRLMRRDLPVLFIAGDADPVGESGKGVRRAYENFLRAGMSDVSLKLYPGGRHEILNELCRNEVYNDVLRWLESKL